MKLGVGLLATLVSLSAFAQKNESLASAGSQNKFDVTLQSSPA